MKSGDRLELHVDRLAFGGSAVGRAPDGRVVFVEGGVPGDELAVTVTDATPTFARARIERLLIASPERVAPRCSLVGTCGGCSWQAASIEVQRRAKQAILARAFQPFAVELEPLLTPAPPFGYRRRARFAADDGRLGFHGARSSDVIDVVHCPLLDPPLERTLAELRTLDRRGMNGVARALSGRQGQIHLALEGFSHRAATPLHGRANIVGIRVGREMIGAPVIDISNEGEPSFLASADGFSQASFDGNRALRSLVEEMAAARGLRVLELYAGDGNLTRDLVAVSQEVLAIEGDAPAVARLQQNVPGAKASAEPVERGVGRLLRSGERFDLVVLDPPRIGARSIVARLAKLTSRIVYVSCDPMTFARDVRDLVALGFHPRRLRGIDMMPQTHHIEVVCLLEAG